MSGGENETIPIGPFWILRIEVHMPCPEDVGERRHPHRQSRVSGLGFLHRIRGQKSDGVDGSIGEVRFGHRLLSMRIARPATQGLEIRLEARILGLSGIPDRVYGPPLPRSM